MHPDDTLGVRFGLNFGSVIQEDGDVFGLAVNAAARVAAKALSGQVLVSESVRSEAARRATTGRSSTAGCSGSRGCASSGASTRSPTANSSSPSPTTRWNDAVRRSRARAVDAARVREPRRRPGHGTCRGRRRSTGVGKTRLLEEIGAEAEATGLQLHRVRCDEVGQSDPYLPFVEVLEVGPAADSAPSDSASRRRARGCHRPAAARTCAALYTRHSAARPTCPESKSAATSSLAVQEVLARLAASGRS